VPEEDASAIFVFKPIVAYLNDPEYTNPIEDDDKWVINENVTFDYPVSVDVSKFVYNISLYMPLCMLSMISMPVENGEGSVFVIPSKMSQSPIIFGRVQPRMSAVTDSGSGSEPPPFFHYAQSTHHMM